MFKMISVLFRKEENSTEEFRHNSDTKHVPLMKSICIIRLYCRMSFQGQVRVRNRRGRRRSF